MSMLVAIVAIGLQTTRPLQPMLAIGCAPQLSQTVKRIGELTEKGDYAAAKEALRLLPKRQVKVQWDDSGAPERSRFDFNEQREMVFREWTRGTPLAQFAVVKQNPDVLFTFVPEGGLTLEWSDDPQKPRLTAKIGVKQGAAALEPATVHNRFSFAIGSYFGVSKLPMQGLIMSGSDAPASAPVSVGSWETFIAGGNVKTCEAIAAQVMRSAPVSSALPTLADDPQPVNLGTVLQGTKVPMDMKIANSGGGILAFKIVPDCSCFATEQLTTVEPNKPHKAIAQMDTREFAGTVHKTLYLLTNDATNPIRTIPVDINITPRYRMLPNRQVVVAGDDGVTFEAYLYAPNDNPLKVKGATSDGLPGTVTVSPWSGEMADPDMNEAAMPRKGYKFTLRVKDVPDGSQFGTNISIATDDPNFPTIMYPVFIQKGILALPGQVFLGYDIGAAPRKISFKVARPGKPFNVTEIVTDSQHITASLEPSKSLDEYLITIAYDGQAAKGDYRATVTIKTDDPKQKVIQVPVSATVK